MELEKLQRVELEALCEHLLATSKRLGEQNFAMRKVLNDWLSSHNGQHPKNGYGI